MIVNGGDGMDKLTMEDLLKVVKRLREVNMKPPIYFCWGCGFRNSHDKHHKDCPSWKENQIIEGNN